MPATKADLDGLAAHRAKEIDDELKAFNDKIAGMKINESKKPEQVIIKRRGSLLRRLFLGGVKQEIATLPMPVFTPKYREPLPLYDQVTYKKKLKAFRDGYKLLSNELVARLCEVNLSILGRNRDNVHNLSREMIISSSSGDEHEGERP